MNQQEPPPALDPAVFWPAFRQASDSIIITDAGAADHSIVYVNPGFERQTGYTSAALVGRNCRLLQGSDRDQEAVARFAKRWPSARAMARTTNASR